MKYLHILLFLSVQLSFSQVSDSDRADNLASAENYSEEIKLRNSILKGIADQNSELYKEQLYKLKLAEFNSSTDPKVRLEKIAEVDNIFTTLKIQDPLRKMNIGLNYYDVYAGLRDAENAIKTLLDLQEFIVLQQPQLEMELKSAFVLLELAKIHLSLYDYDKSLYFFNLSLDKHIEVYGYNSLETAEVFKRLAVAYSYTKNFQEGLTSGDKALEIFETIQPKDPFILFRQYADNYHGYKNYGDVDKMKELYKKITDYYNANKHKSSFIDAKHPNFPNLNAANSTYYFLQLQHASYFSELEKAQEIFLKFKSELPRSTVQFHPYEMNLIHSYYSEMGHLFQKQENFKNMDNYHSAKRFYLEALDFNKKNGYKFGELQIYMFLNFLGLDYEHWEDVIEYTEIALKQPGIENFNNYLAFKHTLGMAYGKMKDYDKAITLLDEEYDFYSSQEINHSYPINHLNQTGDFYLDLYDESSKVEYLEKAYRSFHLSSVIFSRYYRGGEFSKSLHGYLSHINNGLLLSASKLGKNEKEVAEQLEITNSDYLWSSFLNNRKEPFKEASTKLQSQLDSLKIRQNLLAFQIYDDSRDTDEIETLRTELKTTEKNYNRTEKELIKADNTFFQFSRTDFDLENLQAGLKKNEVIVKYIVTDFSAFAYTIGKKDLNLVQLKKTGPELKKLVSDYLMALKTINPKFTLLSKNLYADLVAPLSLKRNSHLVIVPDGFLSNLPFETLLSDDSRYLVQDHAISYAYSLKLFDIQKSLKENSKGLLAAFSPDYSLQYATSTENEDLKNLVRSGNYELLGAKQEARNVNSIFGGDLYLSADATKSNFLENAGKYDILHLAMHAVVNEEDANLSNLIFNDDERLYLSEFYNMKIPAHLAVLSACDTGSGELKEGEGVQSLSRAFTYAGVKSTVMSLWPVPDRETSIIMTSFYNHLKSGKPKNEALQLAKIQYLENVSEVELKHPYYWAGFVVSGDVSPLSTGLSFWWYVGIAITVLLLIFLFLKRKRYL